MIDAWAGACEEHTSLKYHKRNFKSSTQLLAACYCAHMKKKIAQEYLKKEFIIANHMGVKQKCA
jgi:hypothetical protein